MPAGSGIRLCPISTALCNAAKLSQRCSGVLTELKCLLKEMTKACVVLAPAAVNGDWSVGKKHSPAACKRISPLYIVFLRL